MTYAVDWSALDPSFLPSTYLSTENLATLRIQAQGEIAPSGSTSRRQTYDLTDGHLCRRSSTDLDFKSPPTLSRNPIAVPSLPLAPLSNMFHSYSQPTEEQLSSLHRFLHITDVRRYPKPLKPEAHILVSAKSDRYIATSETISAYEEALGTSLDVRSVDGGHVSALFLHESVFTEAVVASMKKL